MGTAPSPIAPEGYLEGISWRAVALGVAVDIGVTFVGNIPLMAVLAPGAFAEDRAAADQAMEQAYASPEFLIVGFAIGLVATVYGAYVGAKSAGAQFLRHGGWIAIVSLLIGLLPLAFWDLGPGPPQWYEALGAILMLPAGLLGGHLARLRSSAA